MSSSDTIVFHLSTGKSSIGETCWMPALATTTSSRPKRFRASLTAASLACGVGQVGLVRRPGAVGIRPEVDAQDVHAVLA